MEIIRFAGIRPEPWRNGGGVTREIARHPLTGEWDWRVSIAEVGTAGAFSTFAGMERVISVIDGELLLLTVDGVEHAMEKYRPFRFSGDAESGSALPMGDIRDLNVIARRGAYKGYLSILELSKKRAHPVFDGQLAILLEGKAAANDDGGEGTGEPVELSRYDAVVGTDEGSPELLGRGFVAVISIDPVSEDSKEEPA
ncbi:MULTISPECIES: HutD family protein [Arthrobacter]|uniref:HutD family protein n=2 Tax=Arthrobacter TaxID=1663 RepID=A0ABU9KP92_9MICC|nr:HutD family protein [Arthrobacter sp. YJM1]MDP5228173.1 HutD family protein [Arthrobacter sp. YJM1]